MNLKTKITRSCVCRILNKFTCYIEHGISACYYCLTNAMWMWNAFNFYQLPLDTSSPIYILPRTSLPYLTLSAWILKNALFFVCNNRNAKLIFWYTQIRNNHFSITDTFHKKQNKKKHRNMFITRDNKK